MTDDRLLMGILGALAAISFVLFLASFAIAHDYARPDLDEWYASTHNRMGTPCCDAGEAEHIEDADWEMRGAHYWVRLRDGQWYVVDDDRIIDGPNKAGTAVVWLYPRGSLHINCFAPGSGT